MKKGLGFILVIVGLVLLAGIAGMDDIMTMHGVFIPLVALAVRLLIPLGMLGAGTALLKGESEC